MKKLLNKRFNKKIQRVLNNMFSEEEYQLYTLGDLFKIIGINILFFGAFILGSICI